MTAHRRMSTEPLVRGASHEDVLSIRDLGTWARRSAHGFQATVPREQHREDGRLHHLLPEAHHLLPPGHGEEVGAAREQRVDAAGDQLRTMRRVGVSEAEERPGRHLRAGVARPLLAEPPRREIGCRDHAQARRRLPTRARLSRDATARRILGGDRARDLTGAVARMIVDHDHLERRIRRGEHRAEAARDVVRFIAGGNDHAHQRRVRRRRGRILVQRARVQKSHDHQHDRHAPHECEPDREPVAVHAGSCSPRARITAAVM